MSERRYTKTYVDQQYVEHEIDEDEVRSRLEGNYKRIDDAMDWLHSTGEIRTPFLIISCEEVESAESDS